MNAATRPAAAQWLSATELEIVWGDDHVSLYRTDYLRARCPCAECAVERRNPMSADLLRPRPTAAGLASPQVEPAGNYGIRIYWRDGHSTGIYPFDHLRGICPCAECATDRAPQQ